MAFAAVNGTELFYIRAGVGEPILFHHGYTGSHDAWCDLVMPHLLERFDCIAMDSRGAGDSAHPDAGHTLEGYASDVIAMADALSIERFTYCGHSMGGLIGIYLALHYPNRLRRLILVAPAPADGVAFPPGFYERLLALHQAKAHDELVQDRLSMSPRLDARVAAKAVARALSVSQAHFEQSWQLLSGVRIGDRLGGVLTPTLLVAGAADRLLEANLRDFPRLGNATLHVFDRVGHHIPSEVPRQLADLIADFMEHGVVTSKTLIAAAAPTGR